MEYKGRQIEDHCYVVKSIQIKCYDENEVNFTIEDLEKWKKAVEDKTAELKGKGVDFKDVCLNIYSDGYHCNDNGPDDDPFMEISVSWLEMETEEQREKRIEKAKKKIDSDLKYEIENEMWRKRMEEREVQEAIDRVQRAGYKVV